MTDVKVTFPKPCDKPWEAMAEHGCNRHCASCDKIVHDLAALTFDEAERLLEGEDEVCVRANVGLRGTIALRGNGSNAARRMVAAAGVTLALATAACQTVPDQREPRYQLTGKFTWKDFYKSAELRSADGRQWPKRREPGTGRFIFDRLAPGTYTLTTEDSCGYRVEVETVTITDASVDIGMAFPQESCIIIGAMVKVVRPEQA